jgi:integrase
MSVMGWSSTSMAARYQRETDPIRHDVARQMGTLLWSTAPDGERSTDGVVGKATKTETETTEPVS